MRVNGNLIKKFHTYVWNSMKHVRSLFDLTVWNISSMQRKNNHVTNDRQIETEKYICRIMTFVIDNL